MSVRNHRHLYIHPARVERSLEPFIMKNTGNAQQWACDVVTDTFDQDFLDQLRILTNSDILLVPRRLKGITSGQNGSCYWNANICAQTWGGKVLYGWSIRTTKIGGIILFGHACWLTPEDKLVDPTYHPSVSKSFFLPYTEKLIINGKATESISNLFYPKTARCVDSALYLAMGSHGLNLFGSRFEAVRNQGYYQGIGINRDRYLNKIAYYDALPYALITKILAKANPDYQAKGRLMFSPCVKPIDQGAPRKLIHDPTLTLAEMKRRFNAEQKPICSLYAGFDITAEWFGKDMVWDSGNFKNPSLVNQSLKTGKSIQDIAPLQEIIDKHSLPTQKKRLQKVMATSKQYSLSPQEVVMLSNPFLFPHPHLMNKAGWESIPRLKTADLITG